MKSGRSTRFPGLGVFGVLLLIAGCQDSITATEDAKAPVEIQGTVDAVGNVVTGPALVDFGTLTPSMRAAICSADVRRPGRSGPMLSRRTALQFGEGAIAAAGGQTATATYQRFDSSGRLIQEVRCTIPRSFLALEAFKDRFVLGSTRHPSLQNGEVIARVEDPPGGPNNPIPIDPFIVESCGALSEDPECQEDEECDPWHDLNWCRCQDNDLNMVAGMDAGGSGTAAFGPECDDDGWEDDPDGGGGGGGGGGEDGPLPDDDPDEPDALGGELVDDDQLLVNPYGCRAIPEYPHASHHFHGTINVRARTQCAVTMAEVHVEVVLQVRRCFVGFCVWRDAAGRGVTTRFGQTEATANSATDCIEGHYRGKSRHRAQGPDGKNWGWNATKTIGLLTC